MPAKTTTPAATLVLILEKPAGDVAAHVIYVKNADETDAKTERAAELALHFAREYSCSVRIDCTVTGSATVTLDTKVAA